MDTLWGVLHSILFNVSTMIFLKPTCAGGGSRPPDRCKSSSTEELHKSFASLHPPLYRLYFPKILLFGSPSRGTKKRWKTLWPLFVEDTFHGKEIILMLKALFYVLLSSSTYFEVYIDGR